MESLALIHPMIVHFPIVLIVLLMLADGVALMRGIPLSGRGGYASVSAAVAVLAGISAVVTAVFGSIAAQIAMSRGIPESVIETHETLGTTTAIAIGSWALIRAAFWWRGTEIAGRRVLGVAAVDLAIFAIVTATAYFGGQLVYDHGVNVMAATG